MSWSSLVLSVGWFSLLLSSLGECAVKTLFWWLPPSSVRLFIVQPRILTCVSSCLASSIHNWKHTWSITGSVKFVGCVYLPSSLGECTVKALVWWPPQPPPSSVGLFIVQPRILTHFVLYLVISLQLKVHFGHYQYQLCLLISSVYKSWLGECAVEALVWWWMKDLFNCYSHVLLCFVSTYANSSISNKKPPPLSAWLFIVRPHIIFFVVSCHLFTIESTLWPLSALSVRWFCLLV